jgi:hypothetical protein
VKSRSGHPKLSRATIVRRKDFTDDLFVLWLEPEGQFPSSPVSTSRLAWKASSGRMNR